MNNIYENISENLIRLRKSKNLTQAEFADIIKYSDKSVSKWETGMSIPSVETLKEIADFYGVTIDDLISNNIDSAAIERAESVKRGSRIVICLLSITIVWLIAVLIYIFGFMNNNQHYWRSFIWAVPATFLVTLVYSYLWNKKFSVVSASLFLWTFIASIFLQFNINGGYLLFILGVPLQVIIILFRILKTDTIEKIKEKYEKLLKKNNENKTLKKEINKLKKEEKSE